MGIKDLFKQKNNAESVKSVASTKLITSNNHYFQWDGNVFQSDIVRSAIRVKSKAIGKSQAKHIRTAGDVLSVNPEPYMRFLLEEPNSLMSMQQLLEKLVIQLELNNNAFALIDRDVNGYPIGIYPISSSNVEALRDSAGVTYLRFSLKGTNKQVIFPYSDIIHLRQDFNENEIFGDSNIETLFPLMNVITTMDQGIIKTIKNSSAIQWLLKFHQNINPDDVKREVDRFVNSFMSMDNENVGAAGVDTKFDAQQVTPSTYVPNADQMDRTTKRIYSYFNINDKIVTSQYNENEWTSFYESSLEPIIVQLSNEFTRKLFTKKERSHGNKIVFESSNLAFASMQTKLGFAQMVDRGAMTPNEWRASYSMHPYPGGDVFLLRKDTGQQSGTTKETEKE